MRQKEKLLGSGLKSDILVLYAELPDWLPHIQIILSVVCMLSTMCRLQLLKTTDKEERIVWIEESVCVGCIVGGGVHVV